MNAPKCIFPAMLQELLDEREILVIKHFADQLKIPPTTFYQWLNGGAICSTPEHVYKLCQYFKVDFDYLFFGIGMDRDDYETIVSKYEEQIKQLQFNLEMAEKEKNLMLSKQTSILDIPGVDPENSEVA